MDPKRRMGNQNAKRDHAPRSPINPADYLPEVNSPEWRDGGAVLIARIQKWLSGSGRFLDQAPTEPRLQFFYLNWRHDLDRRTQSPRGVSARRMAT